MAEVLSDPPVLRPAAPAFHNIHEGEPAERRNKPGKQQEIQIPRHSAYSVAPRLSTDNLAPENGANVGRENVGKWNELPNLVVWGNLMVLTAPSARSQRR